MHLRFGPRRWDVTHRALVFGVVRSAPGQVGTLVDEAAAAVAAGADGLALCPDAGPAETVEAVERLHARFDLPLSVEVHPSGAIRPLVEAGAALAVVVGERTDPSWVDVAAATGVALALTVPAEDGPSGRPDGRAALDDEIDRAMAAGADSESIVADAAFDRARCLEEARTALGASATLAAAGLPVQLSIACRPGKQHPDRASRYEQRVAAMATAISVGCRLIRTTDVAGARRVAAVLASVAAAR